MELLRLLIEDYLKQRENERFQKRIARNFPTGQTVRITNEKISELQMANSVMSDRKIPDMAGQETAAHSKVKNKDLEEPPQTMEEYEASGQLDMDAEEKAQEERIEQGFCEAKAFCRHYQMNCEREGNFIYVETDAGKWYFMPQEGNITLYHKNYELRRNQPETYHVQFTRNCTIRELLWYIYKHDRKKKRRDHRA